MNLAMLWRVLDSKEAEKRAGECEESLKRCLDTSISQFGAEDALTATILSNYGLFLKDQSRFDEAQKVYESALDVRSATLGDTHPDTIVSMHNLAECLLSMGQEVESIALQEKILQTMGNVMEEGRGGEDLRSGNTPESLGSGDGTDGDKGAAEVVKEKEEKQSPTKPLMTYATRPKKRKEKKK